MKVYVSELPKKCADCPFYKLDTYVDVYGYQTNSHECVLNGSMLTNSCPLQSLADHTKQVRKDVVEEIRKEIFEYLKVNSIEELEKLSLLDSTLTYDVITDKLDQMQGE